MEPIYKNPAKLAQAKAEAGNTGGNFHDIYLRLGGLVVYKDAPKESKIKKAVKAVKKAVKKKK